MRRTSWVAPLLLIALGALFLARNLHPELPLLDYLARYWPFLLIGWGVLRLAEILYWASMSATIYRGAASPAANGSLSSSCAFLVFRCILYANSPHGGRETASAWAESKCSAKVSTTLCRAKEPVQKHRAW